jgi:DnaK suppressor protein
MSNPRSSLTREFIEQQRQRLNALREQLLGAEEQTDAGERAFEEEYGGEAQEIEDRAQDVSQSETNQALKDADQRRLRNVERALQKIDEGTYGFSDLSGTPIPKARLDASPEAVLTIDEERRAERQ